MACFKNMEIRFVYITCKNPQEAADIGQKLVQEKLAACANILPDMQSIYTWQGELKRDSEAILIAKTTADRFRPLEARVKALHSYECPCIVALPVSAGYAPYLDWIRQEIKASE